MRRIALLAIAAGFVVPLMATAPAHAQATRTWVSGVGDDVNPCSRTAPCKTFAGAISKTAAGGEINCLDPGGFGGVTITKAMQIICQVEAGVLVSGTNAIIVNTPANAEVLLDGLDIEGLGTGLNGIRIISASKVTVRRSSIRNFTGNGIDLNGPAGARLMVEDTMILSNNNGISIVGNPAGSSNVAIVNRTTIDNHPGNSITVAAGSTLLMGGSFLVGSTASVANSGTFTSFGNNALGGTGTPTSTINLR